MRRLSLSAGLAGSLLAGTASAQLFPEDTPILFPRPVTGNVLLANPGNYAYQVYAPENGLIRIDSGGSLTFTNGAFVKYGGTIVNNGELVLGRDASSGRLGSIAFLGNGAPITFTTDPGAGGVLRMLGGSIYTSFNYFQPGPDTARVINGVGHLITNSDGGVGTSAYTGAIGGLQLTNEGDIYSVRSGGVLNLSLSALGNTGGIGQHVNTATGRIAAYDSGRINISVRGYGGIIDAPNTFINNGLMTTVQPGVLVGGGGVAQTGGGTIRLSSLVSLTTPGSLPGSFEGNNPEILAGGRLELSEIRFINTLPSATPGGPRVGKTLTADNGTIRIEGLVTIEGGRVVGDATPNHRFEIGVGLLTNTFRDVEFSGTFFGRGNIQLLGTTDISRADFRQLTPADSRLLLVLGANQTFNDARNYMGDVRFASDSSVTLSTLTLNAPLTSPDSLGFGNLILAGSGQVNAPVIRIAPNLDLSGYSGVLRPNNLGGPFGGGQLRLEGGTFTAPLSPKLNYVNSTLVLDGATYDLAGTTLTPSSTFSALRLENNATLLNGRLDSTGANVTVAASRLQQLSITGTINVEGAISLDRVLPANASEFIGTDYTVTLGAASLATPWRGAGGTLRFNTTGGGTVSLDTALASQALPSDVRIAADTIRLVGNLSGNLPDAQFAAGPSGSLRLILGANGVTFPSGAPAYANTQLGAIDVAGGNLRLEYQSTNYAYPATARAYLFAGDAITVDGRLTVASSVTLNPFDVYNTGSAVLPAALRALAFTFENNSISGLHLRTYDPFIAATVDLAPGMTTLLAAADTTTYLNGGTLVIGDSGFSFDPLNPVAPTTTALVAPPVTGISNPGQVSADGTLVFSGVALTGNVSESVTPAGSSYLPRTLPDQSQLGTITAQNITLRNGTLAGTRYESFEQSGDHIRRWTQAPNLVATGDINLGTPGVLRLETGRYALESNLSFGQLVVGTGATLTRRSNLTPGYVSFVGDSLAADPDLSPVADTPALLEFRAPYPSAPYALVLDGGRIEGLTLASLPAPFFSNGTARSGALVLTRATFSGDSGLIGTLDHATGAVTRFESGYTFALGGPDSNGEYQPQLLRPTPGLTGADRRFGIEIAAVGAVPAPVTVQAAGIYEQSTLLQGNVTVTGISGQPNAPARLNLLSNGTIYQPVPNLRHSEGTLTFAGNLHVNVNGLLESADHIVFARDVQLSGNGTVRAANGIELNGQTLPGNSPGTLTFEGDVTFGATHDLVLEIGSAHWVSDHVVVVGHLTAGGKLTLLFTEGYNPLAFNGFFTSAFPLVSATSFSGSFASFEIQGIDPALFDATQFAKILPAGLVVAVPEPSAYAMFCAGIALLVMVASRRRRFVPARV